MNNLEELRDGIIHADCADGNDYTLCGVSADNIIPKEDYRLYRNGETECEPYMAKTSRKITCPKCAAIIRHCIKLGLRSIGDVKEDFV